MPTCTRSSTGRVPCEKCCGRCGRPAAVFLHQLFFVARRRVSCEGEEGTLFGALVFLAVVNGRAELLSAASSGSEAAKSVGKECRPYRDQARPGPGHRNGRPSSVLEPEVKVNVLHAVHDRAAHLAAKLRTPARAGGIHGAVVAPVGSDSEIVTGWLTASVQVHQAGGVLGLWTIARKASPTISFISSISSIGGQGGWRGRRSGGGLRLRNFSDGNFSSTLLSLSRVMHNSIVAQAAGLAPCCVLEVLPKRGRRKHVIGLRLVKIQGHGVQADPSMVGIAILGICFAFLSYNFNKIRLQAHTAGPPGEIGSAISQYKRSPATIRAVFGRL